MSDPTELQETPYKNFTQTWECTACSDKDHPCTISVVIGRTGKLGQEYEDRERLIYRGCICNETPFPEWRYLGSKAHN